MSERTARAEAIDMLRRAEHYDITTAEARALTGIGWALLAVDDAIREATPVPTTPAAPVGGSAGTWP